jgi:hypothetical protein
MAAAGLDTCNRVKMFSMCVRAVLCEMASLRAICALVAPAAKA